MKRRSTIQTGLAIGMVLLVASPTKAGEADDLLKRWCDGLIALQVKEPARAELKGGVLCPACGFLHGRICDVVYPFAHLYATTGERKYLDAAEGALVWCERNMLFQDGLLRNDRQVTWRSTTAFFAISLWKALSAYSNSLPAETRTRWRGLFLQFAESAYVLYENDFRPVVNYFCVYPELMFLAWRETGEAKYLDAAKRMADRIRTTFFDEEGFLVGEGRIDGRLEGRTAKGCAMVDLGYNLEESLTALLEYADLAQDADLRAKAVASAKLQLAFVLPDGAIDNSCGSRSVKWTYYGSRTSDGILTLLTLMRKDVPYAAEMARRVLSLYARCTGGDGLIAGGLMYAEAGEPACVHHSFARAKTLVDYIRSGLADDSAKAPLPREASPAWRHYRALGADLVAQGPWRATFSANDAFNCKRDAAVSGGSLSLLWHEAVGPVAVGTLGAYFYAEPHNMQDDRHDRIMQCLTPRIRAGRLSNIFDYETRANGLPKGDAFAYAARGRLTDERGRKGADYALAYTLDARGLTLRAETADRTAKFVFPLVAGPKDEVRVKDGSAVIRRGGRTLTLTASAPLAIERGDRGERIWSPVTGMLCVPLAVSLEKPVTLTLTCEEGPGKRN